MSKILVADDSQFMRKVIIEILNKAGHTEITEASTGPEAIKAYEENKPDLVLLDVIMPEKDGTEVLKEIVPKGAKAIVISAVGQDSILDQTKELGALGYIIKPFDETKVLEEVNKALAA